MTHVPFDKSVISKDIVGAGKVIAFLHCVIKLKANASSPLPSIKIEDTDDEEITVLPN